MKLRYLLALLGIGVLCSVSPAQTITASITGTATDPTGAAIPNAKIVATNTGTGVPYSAISNTAGVYNLTFLPVGNYNIVAENQGFKRSSVGPFGLEVNQIARIDFKMEIGELTQTVEVTGAAPILQTESTATGDAINSAKLTSIPLNGRNFSTLTLLIPGAISTSPTVMSPVSEQREPPASERQSRADQQLP